MEQPRLRERRYVIERLIGDGAMATVWRAHDRETGQPVAVKVLKPDVLNLEDVQRLAQEVNILRQLSHPGIVRLHGTGVAEAGTPYVVMEWVEGIDLRTRLDSSPPLPSRDVAEILGQVCAALAEAHAQQVIHRDVKPENVLLCAPEHLAVKVVDFGMAKVIGPRAAALTLDNKIFGTPQYMAPERARGLPVDAHADVYAVAVMAYEMLSGARPFDGPSPIVVLTQQIKEPPPPLRGYPAAVEAAVLAGLAKDPLARPTAREFAQRLDAALAGC